MAAIVRPRPAAKDYHLIERIDEKRIDVNSQASYLLKWLGYEEAKSTWVPPENLR